MERMSDTASQIACTIRTDHTACATARHSHNRWDRRTHCSRLRHGPSYL